MLGGEIAGGEAPKPAKSPAGERLDDDEEPPEELPGEKLKRGGVDAAPAGAPNAKPVVDGAPPEDVVEPPPNMAAGLAAAAAAIAATPRTPGSVPVLPPAAEAAPKLNTAEAPPLPAAEGEPAALMAPLALPGVEPGDAAPISSSD